MLKNLNLPQKITDCEAKIEDLKAKNEQAIRSRSLIANLKTEITQLENQISSLTQRKNTVAAQKADYQTRKNNIDAQIRNKQTELDGLLVNSSEELAITDRISTLENQLNVSFDEPRRQTRISHAIKQLKPNWLRSAASLSD